MGKKICHACGIFILAITITVAYLLVVSRIHTRELILKPIAVFTDRHGIPLRYVPDEKGERHVWAPVSEIPDRVRNAFLAAEDERFYDHFGFDPPAIIRAIRDNLRGGCIVSGASTITQQLSRMAYPRKRNYHDKLVEIVRSVRIEMALSKESILEYYLNRVPLGNNLRGVEMASRVYFGKNTKELSLAEAALLASLPKAPGKLNPYGTELDQLHHRKDWVLERMTALGFLSAKEMETAQSEKVFFLPRSFPFAAPHLVDRLLQKSDPATLHGKIRTTIDLALQLGVEGILASHKTRLHYKGASQAAAVVMDNKTMDILAMVGSLRYGPEDQGLNNGATAWRSPGSTLKPLVYGLAIESGYMVTSLLEDTLRRYRTPQGDYSPVNYDRHEYGPVTMRTALANSLNVSAIRMLNQLGQEPFYGLLKRVGLINHPENSHEHYGLGLVLGNPEVSLEQLAAYFAMLANGGVYRPVRYISDAPVPNGERILCEETAYILTDILSDPSARSIAFGGMDSMNFPFRVALKTGTSTRYRDAWIVGYTPEYTVAIWTGNFNGDPTFGLSGAVGAAPILKEIMMLLYGNGSPGIFVRPKRIVEVEVCGISGMRPGDHCDYVVKELFVRGNEPKCACTFHQLRAHLHELPAGYALWLHDKERRGEEGGYRIKGMKYASKGNLSPAFPSEGFPREPSIRIKGAVSKKSKPAAKEPPKRDARPHVEGHVSIGVSRESFRKNRDCPIHIVYPMHGDRFVLDGFSPYGNRAIRFEAVSSNLVEYVDWYIDGQHYRRIGPPYYTFWQPQRGRHRISAVAPGTRGECVDILVE